MARKSLDMNAETDWREWKESDFLAGWEVLPQGSIDVTISKIEADDVFTPQTQTKEEKVILHFKECKPMILNVVNRKNISKALGTNIMQKWVGGRITIHTEKVKAFGDVHDALRVKRQAPKPAAEKAPVLPVLKSGTDAWDGVISRVKELAGEGQEFETIYGAVSKKFKVSATAKKQLKEAYDEV
jgi:hypothetical protein